jgi:hypothetical protein
MKSSLFFRLLTPLLVTFAITASAQDQSAERLNTDGGRKELKN